MVWSFKVISCTWVQSFWFSWKGEIELGQDHATCKYYQDRILRTFSKCFEYWSLFRSWRFWGNKRTCLQLIVLHEMMEYCFEPNPFYFTLCICSHFDYQFAAHSILVMHFPKVLKDHSLTFFIFPQFGAASLKIKPFLAIALNVASKSEEFHPLWVLHLQDLELCSMLLMDHDMVTAVDTVDETSHFLRNSIPPPPSGWKFDTIPSSYKRAEKRMVRQKIW